MLEDLQFLRNLYAHHGGDFSHEKPSRVKRIDAITRAHDGLTVTEKFLVVDATYLRHASDCAFELVEMLRRIHPSLEPGLVEFSDVSA